MFALHDSVSRGIRAVSSENWDRFWEAYPRKVGKDPAEKKFVKMSDGEQLAAIADVEKRNRMAFWSANKKLIAMPATYLNQKRWLDEWMDEVKPVQDENFQSRGAVDFVPRDEVYVSRWKAMMNRMAFRWLWHSGGLESNRLVVFEKMLKDFISDNEADFENDYVNGDKETRGECVWTFVGLLLSHLDDEFDRTLKYKLMHERRRVQS